MYRNCKKCGSTLFHTEIKGNNTGLYCNKCGTWQKWLNKNELKAFEYNTTEMTTKNRIKIIDKQDILKEKTIEDRINDFLEFIEKYIDNEMDKLPISAEDAIRKNAYCLGLVRCKNSIINILNGKDYNYKES